MSGRRYGSQNDVPSKKATSEQQDAPAQIERIYINAYYEHPGGEETQRKMTCKSIESAREFIDELEMDADVPSDDESGGGQK